MIALAIALALTPAQSEAVAFRDKVAEAVFYDVACMPYLSPDQSADLAREIDPNSYPETFRELIAYSVKEGRSVHPTYDRCLHIFAQHARDAAN